MCNPLGTGVAITLTILVICIIIGCGDDGTEGIKPPSEADVDPPAATKAVIDPSPPPKFTGNAFYTVNPDTVFTFTFDAEVVAVIVNGTPATGLGLHWKWSAHPDLPEGSVTLEIMWTNRDGSRAFAKAGPYYFSWGHGEPPVITGGTVNHGDVDVDPAPLNASGFRFDFDEAVTGTIKLTDEAGVDLHWDGNVQDQTATLTPVAGQELVSETTYKVEIDVQDGAGNRSQITIPFATKVK